MPAKKGDLSELASIDPDTRTDSDAQPGPKDVTTAAANIAKEDVKKDKEEPATADQKPDAENASSISPTTTADAGVPQRPPRPSRRKSAFSSNLDELTSAFPDSSLDVCRGMLVAASNNLENAFSGMLAISDSTIRPAAYVREQIESDEQLARRLAMSDQQRRRHSSGRRHSSMRHIDYNMRDDDEADTFAGDEVYDGLQRGLNETKQAVSSFWGTLKTRISGEIFDDDVNDVPSGGSRGNREPLRSQWFPRQPSGGSVQTSASAPRLPPRKPSRPSESSTPATPISGSGRTPAATPGNKDSADTTAAAFNTSSEPKSVNAFGDESKEKPDDQEPDAFFIGESDDDDLGSLNDEDVSAAPPSAEKKLSEGLSEDAKAADKPSKESEKEDKAEESKNAAAGKGKKEDAPSAKELLSKFKTETPKSPK